jgi:uncharacterized phiE125 gp8 family phage protein
MTWSTSVITVPPAALPLALADVRGHCYADPGGADDAVLGAYLAASVDQVQAITGLRLINQTVQLTRDDWGDFCQPLRFPIGPVQSVSFAYLDPAGAAQTLDPTLYALVGAKSLAASVALIGGKVWPQVLDHPAAITCTAVVGYGADGTSVPGAVLQAIRLLTGDYFANREDTIAERSVVPATLPNGVDALLANYTVW